jgi:hypothetical protein
MRPPCCVFVYHPQRLKTGIMEPEDTAVYEHICDMMPENQNSGHKSTPRSSLQKGCCVRSMLVRAQLQKKKKWS